MATVDMERVDVVMAKNKVELHQTVLRVQPLQAASFNPTDCTLELDLDERILLTVTRSGLDRRKRYVLAFIF